MLLLCNFLQPIAIYKFCVKNMCKTDQDTTLLKDW